MNRMASQRMKLHSRIVYAMRRAGWQTHYSAAVTHVKRRYLIKQWGVESSTQLTEAQLDAAIQDWTVNTKLAPPMDKQFAIPTEAEIRKIVRLGKYRLGNVYGDNWFWKHLPQWVRNHYQQLDNPLYPLRKEVKHLNSLTQAEAEHVIRVLEQIEHKAFKVNA